jgi:hypothetical protein
MFTFGVHHAVAICIAYKGHEHIMNNESVDLEQDSLALFQDIRLQILRKNNETPVTVAGNAAEI